MVLRYIQLFTQIRRLWRHCFDKQYSQLNIVLRDYSKAFDTVLPNVLSNKGFSHEFVQLMNFLSNRSILRPILFSLNIYSFAQHLNYCKIHFYAANVRLYYSFKQSKCIEASGKINKHLFNIHIVSTTYSLRFNRNNFQVYCLLIKTK